ncbi:inhibitor of growth protein 2-like isoform X2 [Pomacea canaliculata]|uniref:inhibitor of growth protein 2-like isoform X2 n=1 Tax=Pomacea canaliculata TaxID=400727 RepID=UPI000D7334B7|nr:inhibitor of growth protein 2-like isoform X2 [Pomacea canaliculata]
MSVLNHTNHAAVEALCAGTYLESYLDTMESLPDDLQRNVTMLRELDIQAKEYLQDLEQHCTLFLQGTGTDGGAPRKKSFISTHRALVKCQEIGDEKLALLSVITEHIENRTRLLEQTRENLEPGSTREQEKEEVVVVRKEVKQPEPERIEKPGAKRQRRQKAGEPPQEDTKEEKDKGTSSKKKKKRKTVKKERDDSALEFVIDPNEPTYCVCNQVSYGEMIGCDNNDCKLEWFHFNCVGLTTKPKGKWYCPDCRGDKPTVKKTDK